ncbi:MAG: hypothetical protein RIQ37_718 [Actinomycetota bacterium]
MKILQEPVIKSFWTHRFTYRHSGVYDLVLTHSGGLGKRIVRTHGHFPMHVSAPLVFPEKSKLFSIVASTLRILPGHQARADAVDSLLLHRPELIDHAFGKGRRYVESKEDALRDYRYSLAIENDSSPSYFTEKILDCFAMGVVPIYFGAPDIETFFPANSLIKLPDLRAESIEEALSKISELDYEQRLPDLKRAAKLALKYSRLCCLASELVDQNLSPVDSKPRWKLLAPLDTFTTFLWRLLVNIASKSGLLKLLQAIKSRLG